MLLPVHEFAQVIDRTPLVSLDLLVENGHGEFLLGLRTNRPAQGFWFVPDGKVRKGETLAQAFERLTLAELGHAFSLQDAEHQDLYELFTATMRSQMPRLPVHQYALCGVKCIQVQDRLRRRTSVKPAHHLALVRT